MYVMGFNGFLILLYDHWHYKFLCDGREDGNTRQHGWIAAWTFLRFTLHQSIDVLFVAFDINAAMTVHMNCFQAF